MAVLAQNLVQSLSQLGCITIKK